MERMAAGKDTEWSTPMRVGELVDRSATDYRVLPPRSNGVYLVTEASWSVSGSDCWEAIRTAGALYVGGNSSNSERFRTRIGDLLADLFGMYARGRPGETGDGKSTGTGHHSAGQTLNLWCWLNRKSAADLHIAWQSASACPRCGEWEAFWRLRPDLLNVRTPPRCGDACTGSTWNALRALQGVRTVVRQGLPPDVIGGKASAVRGIYNSVTKSVSLLDEAPPGEPCEVSVVFRDQETLREDGTCDVLVLFPRRRIRSARQ